MSKEYGESTQFDKIIEKYGPAFVAEFPPKTSERDTEQLVETNLPGVWMPESVWEEILADRASNDEKKGVKNG